MTDAEWLDSENPLPMLELVRSSASDRKLRLLACACLRSIWSLLDTQSKRAVRAAEHFGDGKIKPLTLRNTIGDWPAAAIWGAVHLPGCSTGLDMHASVKCTITTCATNHVTPSFDANVPTGGLDKQAQEFAQQAMFLKCVLNPFYSITIDPTWLTSAATGIAQGIYRDRAFDRLPILADALQDAGCEDADLLGHCRSDGPHVRGCWVVDLVLGKS